MLFFLMCADNIFKLDFPVAVVFFLLVIEILVKLYPCPPMFFQIPQVPADLVTF